MGAKLNGVHTDTYGLKLKGAEIGIPTTQAIRERLPAGNHYVTTGQAGTLAQRPIRLLFDNEDDYKGWLRKITEIASDVNGQEVEVELDEEPGCYYYGLATVSSLKENDVITEFTIELQADPYKYKDYVTVSLDKTTARTITVQSGYETPCIIEVNPTTDIIDYTLTGVARNPTSGEQEPITLRNLRTGKKVVIDGEAGTVMQDGQNKFGEADMWEFPSLKPGSNYITCSKALCNVNIKYRPLYI